MHPHREILALYIRRADMLGVGFARDLALFRADALGRAISLLAARLCAINLLQHRVVNVAERIIDRVDV